MAYAIGIVLALGACGLARWIGLDRSRAFYPTLLIVIASYYVLFGVMGGSTRATALESIVMVGFILVAAAGFRFNPWLVVLGLAGHGVFDFFHGLMVENPGVPAWWPAFCLAFDVAAAGILAWLLKQGESRGGDG